MSFQIEVSEPVQADQLVLALHSKIHDYRSKADSASLQGEEQTEEKYEERISELKDIVNQIEEKAGEQEQ